MVRWRWKAWGLVREMPERLRPFFMAPTAGAAASPVERNLHLTVVHGLFNSASLNMAGALDVAVAAGRIAAVTADIPEKEARQVIGVRGKLVTPGLIDMHAHVAAGLGVPGLTELNVEPHVAGALRA